VTFVDAGFLALPGLLTGEGLTRVRAVADAAVAAPSGASCERPNNTLVPLRWDSEVIEVLLGCVQRIGAAVHARDLRWISGYISVKDPHSPPLWWHQDWWAWDHPVSFQSDPVQVALLCYLSDTTEKTGALRVIPGSHLASVPLHALLPEAHGDESTGLDAGHPAMRDHPAQVTVEASAGDAVVCDYRLLHGTHAHTGDYRRDCVLLSFAPHWSDLPEEVRGHLIRHPALPGPNDPAPRPGISALLPSYDGERRDLPLNMEAPSTFATLP
jgi:ectoine hydroxylase-related dioxygenase (phytanoyl-CoA dioxygenase family)